MVIRHEGNWKVIFPPETTRHLAYGLGWFVHDYRSRQVVSHGGAHSGFRAQIAFVPDAHCGVVVLGNLGASRFTEALSYELLDHLLGLPSNHWSEFYRKAEAKAEDDVKKERKKRAEAKKPNAKPSLELEAYAGSYEEPAYGKAEVDHDKVGMIVRLAGMTFRLEHYQFDTFTATLTAPEEPALYAARMNLQAQFRVGVNGEVEGMRFLDQDFKQVRAAAK